VERDALDHAFQGFLHARHSTHAIALFGSTAAACGFAGDRYVDGMSTTQLDKTPETSGERVGAGRRAFATGLTIAYAIVAVFVRLIPYGVRPPNFAANGALGLFGGSRASLWIALPAQILSLVISDIILSKVFPWKPFNVSVYVSFIIYMLLGRFLLRGKDSIARIAGVTFLGSLQFYLITNFGTWLEYSGIIGSEQRLYDNTLAGLLLCMGQGLPFFGFTAAGDLGFSAALFGAEAWLYGVVHGTKPVEEAAS
jgi:hypothetical protein